MIFDFPAEVTRDHRERAASALLAGGPTVAMWIAGKETRLDRNADPLDPDLPRLAQSFADFERELVTVDTKSVATGGGDYDEECTGCAQTVADPHSFRECLANIAVGRDLILANALQVDREDLALRAELEEVKAGYHTLDRNWDAIHNGAMEAIRGALEMPDASVPEMVIRIRDMSLAKPESVLMPPQLFVFTDGNGTYVIARNKFDVGAVLMEEDLKSADDPDDDWRLVLPTEKIQIKVDRDGCIAPADEIGEYIRVREQTAAEWLIQVNKRGLLCTSEY
jgi:hypothetical protein